MSTSSAHASQPIVEELDRLILTHVRSDGSETWSLYGIFDIRYACRQLAGPGDGGRKAMRVLANRLRFLRQSGHIKYCRRTVGIWSKP